MATFPSRDAASSEKGLFGYYLIQPLFLSSVAAMAGRRPVKRGTMLLLASGIWEGRQIGRGRQVSEERTLRSSFVLLAERCGPEPKSRRPDRLYMEPADEDGGLGDRIGESNLLRKSRRRMHENTPLLLSFGCTLPRCVLTAALKRIW